MDSRRVRGGSCCGGVKLEDEKGGWDGGVVEQGTRTMGGRGGGVVRVTSGPRPTDVSSRSLHSLRGRPGPASFAPFAVDPHPSVLRNS